MAARKIKSKMPLSRKIANLFGITGDVRRRWKRRIDVIRAVIHDHLGNLIPPRELVFQTFSVIQSEIVNYMVDTSSFSWRLADKVGKISNRVPRWWPGSNKISPTAIAKLPPELVIHIVARMNLSVCSMVNTFPCAWLSIMTHPQFCLIQNSRDHPGPWRSRSVSLIFGNIYDNFPNGYTLVQKDIELDRFVSIKLKSSDFGIKDNRSRDYFNPCNGLLGVYTYGIGQKASYYICNPLTGEWVMLPDSDPRKHDIMFRLMGFGYSPDTNQYKLVRMRITLSDSLIDSVFGEVYTVGGDCGGWRRIEDDTMFQMLVLGNSYAGRRPVAFNGVLHWLYTPDCIHYEVICFDVGTEQLTSFSLPNTAGYCIEYIGVLHGCFIVWNYKIDSSAANYCQLWVLKDYSVKESWVKLGDYVGSYNRFEDVEDIIDVDEDGKKVLIAHDLGRLSYYFEAKTGSTTFMNTSRSGNMNKVCGIAPGESCVMSFVPGLLSPRHLLQL